MPTIPTGSTTSFIFKREVTESLTVIGQEASDGQTQEHKAAPKKLAKKTPKKIKGQVHAKN